jgi:hypothetical protein
MRLELASLWCLTRYKSVRVREIAGVIGRDRGGDRARSGGGGCARLPQFALATIATGTYSKRKAVRIDDAGALVLYCAVAPLADVP